VPRSYQVTPGHPDRRRATQRKPVRPTAADSLNSESARRRSGPSPQRRTSPTPRITTASLDSSRAVSPATLTMRAASSTSLCPQARGHAGSPVCATGQERTRRGEHAGPVWPKRGGGGWLGCAATRPALISDHPAMRRCRARRLGARGVVAIRCSKWARASRRWARG